VFVEADEEAVEEAVEYSPWKALAEGAHFYPLPAGHMEILEEPNIRTWAEPVGALLELNPTVAPAPEASCGRRTGWEAGDV
jgi:thioesterase domain-containing protein